jgi:glycosyltransferase involved in cell wall biosynthesis
MIVGGGRDFSRLKQFTKEYGLTDKVIFTGFKREDEVPKYIASADVAVACFEANNITKCKSPLKIVEYLASGKPIVGSDVGDVGRMLGGAGILTKPGDTNSLADGILKLLNNKKLRNELGKKARKRAEEEYNWGVTAENLLEAYYFALKDHK